MNCETFLKKFTFPPYFPESSLSYLSALAIFMPLSVNENGELYGKDELLDHCS